MAQQYLDNIMVIANYKLTDIIAQALQEEYRKKAQSLRQGLSLSKFSTEKNLGQNALSVESQTTQCKIIGLEGSIQLRARGNQPRKHQVPTGTKRKQTNRERAKQKKRHNQVPMY